VYRAFAVICILKQTRYTVYVLARDA